ncbi:hypothetical protein M9H77_23139 [Catharanthus roseus]|uniref:Uncharacterized protein n=1 Tax=Catharanthus roseus TaxID=4058 RepID=A0ACC0AT64_CATRO|nr:hypothetical protein M9H77_23139 [Catharanthus roseus]
MEYDRSNPLWKRMEAKSKQEDYQSKLARDMHNFHHGGGNGVNAYGGSNWGHGNFISRGHDGYGNFTPKKHNGVGNFSSYTKSYGYTSYDDYGGYDRDNAKYDYYEHSPYDSYEEYHHSYEFSKVNEIPQAIIEVKGSVVLPVKEEISNVEHCDLMRDKNIEKESIEIKEEERVENKERLVERSCIFDSISIFLKANEHLECSKEKESELEKKKKRFIELNSSSCAIPRIDEYHFNIAKYASCVLGVEDKGRSMEKELGTILEELM